MQLTEPFILREMSVQSNGHFTVRPAGRELSLSEDYILQSKKHNFEKLRINNPEKLKI